MSRRVLVSPRPREPQIGEPLRAWFTRCLAEWTNNVFEQFRSILKYLPDHELTEAEVTAGVTPTSYQYEPGDVRRYGADPSGVADSSSALTGALAANEEAFDKVGGTYLIDNVAIPADNRTIRGLGPGRTVFKRGSTNPIFKTTTARTHLTIRDCTLDGNSEYTSDICNFVAGTNDVLFDNVEYINFDSGSSASTAIEWATATATANERITLRNCYFNNRGGSVLSNYNTVIIYNPNVVRIEGCVFHTCGNLATAFNASYTSVPGGNIQVIRNTFIGVDSSVVLIRVNGANILENVECNFNEFYDCSPTLGKYCMSLGHQAPATTGGIVRNVTAIGNTGRLTDVDCDGFILVGDTGLSGTVTNVNISSNAADFRDSSGAVVTTGNADQRGIWLTNCRNFTIGNNSIVGTQSSGIILSACLNGTIDGNAVQECVQNSASGGIAIESGIYIAQGTAARISITSNIVIDAGGGGATQSGIGCASSGTISDIYCGDNNLEDTRGTAKMVYGLNFGAAAVRVIYGFNRVRNPLTASYNPASPGIVAYTPTNVTTDRAFDANRAAGAISNPPTQAEVTNLRDTALELADIVATIIADLQGKGTFQ